MIDLDTAVPALSKVGTTHKEVEAWLLTRRDQERKGVLSARAKEPSRLIPRHSVEDTSTGTVGRRRAVVALYLDFGFGNLNAEISGSTLMRVFKLLVSMPLGFGAPAKVGRPDQRVFWG